MAVMLSEDQFNMLIARLSGPGGVGRKKRLEQKHMKLVVFNGDPTKIL